MKLMKSRFQITALFFLSLSFLSFCGYSSAATFNVSTTSEFRQALLDAAGNGENDTIILNAGTYKTTDDGQGTFMFSDSEAHNLTIKAKDGLTRDDVILDGDNTDQVLNFSNTETDSVCTVDSITVQNGDYESNVLGGGKAGGGIGSSNKIIITNTTISNNVANHGGGICANRGGSVMNSTVSNNIAYGPRSHGGGIYSSGDVTITITNSVISNNLATSFSISNNLDCTDCNKKFNTNGNETVKKPVITGNIDPLLYGGTGYGGGISVGGSPPGYDYGKVNVIITNSTISNNRSALSGGGVYSENSITVINSTINGNSAYDYGDGIYSKGNFINNIFIEDSIYFTGTAIFIITL